MAHPVERIILGGKRNDAPVGMSAELRDPWDLRPVGRMEIASRDHAETAVRRAAEGFTATRALPSYRRAEILQFIAGAIRTRKEIFAGLITEEVGKPIQYSRVEVDRAVLTFETAAAEAVRIGGETIPLDVAASSAGRYGITRRFPVGIVLCVAPFNYPLNLVAHKVAPAIAAGNAFILKPAPQAPRTSLLLGDIIAESGFPRDAFSVLLTDNETAELLVRDARIGMLSFTGSAKVGWHLKSVAGKKKVLLELGGNAGAIVDETADIDDAVRRTVIGSFGSAGQVCIKVQRIYVHERVFPQFLKRFVDAAKSLATGDPRKEETVVGPLIDDSAAERVERWIRDAVAAGAQLQCGGRRAGRVVEPTVLTDVALACDVYTEEVFGPVTTIHPFRSFDDAIAGINDTRYGLQAGVFTNDYRHVMDAFDRLDVGAVVMNDTPTYRVDPMPYGGIKDSGFGREGLRFAIEAMTEPKLLVMNPS